MCFFLIFVIAVERLKESRGAFFFPGVGMEEFLRRRVAYKIEFYKHRRHRHAPKHPESGLAHFFVGAAGLIYKIALGPGCKVEALVEVSVLRKFKYYI